METPKENIEGDGRKTLRHFMNREVTYPPDKTLRVRIVSKPQPDDGEHSDMEDSPKSEEVMLDDFNNEIGAQNGTYISRRLRGEDFSTTGDDSVEEVMGVNSKLLSRESSLFFKLFSQMKRGLQEEPPTIQIEASEEHAFVALLEFIHFSSLPPSSYEEIVDLLMMADEFQVLSCAAQCTYRLVYKLNSAFSCFELCHKVQWITVREFLAAEAMSYVTQSNSDIMSIKEELLQQPFSRIKALFCMDNLKVESEDAVYDFILCWAQAHYPQPEDHYSAKKLHLERLIRFIYLTRQKLEDAVRCDFFYPESVSESVIEALAFKIGEPYRRRLPMGCCSRNHFLERHYKRTPIAVNRLWFPEFDRCEVYFSLAKSELVDMFHFLGRRETQDFQFGRQVLSLVASCKEVGRIFCFDLSITAKAEMLDENVYATRFMVCCSAGWIEIGTGSFIPAGPCNAVDSDLLPGFWTQLLNRTCPFILDGFLHLRVEITCKRQDRSAAI